MMELFGNPGARFFAVYNDHLPIDSGYAEGAANFITSTTS